MSLQPPKATHVGQVWQDPITAEKFVWTGPSGTNDYWSEWECWTPQTKRDDYEAAQREGE